MDLEHFDIRIESKALTDAGTFTGYASVFGVKDDGYDIVERGAFAQSLADFSSKNRKIPMLWGHDPKQPIGFYPQAKEDDKGLWVEGKFATGVPQASSVHALMKEDVINGLSIGFRTKRYEIDQDTGVRRIKELELFEISVVTFPMLDVARVTDVKNNLSFNPRELEREFKEGGLSNDDAVSAVAIVKKYLQREAVGNKTPAREVSWGTDLLKSLREARADLSK